LVGVARAHRVEPADVFLLARINVLLAGAVAGFTGLAGPSRGRARVLRFAVQRRVEAFSLGLVTRGTRLVADESARLPCAGRRNGLLRAKRPRRVRRRAERSSSPQTSTARSTARAADGCWRRPGRSRPSRRE